MTKVQFDVRDREGAGVRDGFTVVTDALLALDGRHSGQDYICPAHDDQRPSLGVTTRNGKVLVNCMAGCRTADIMAALGLPMGLLANGSGPAGGKGSGPHEALPTNDAIWRWMRNLTGEPLRYWTERRGISRDVLQRYEIGWNPEARSTDGSGRVGAYVFPYRDASGKLLNVKRRWQAEGEHKKTFRLNAGHERDFLWPPDQLGKKSIVLIEGEPDAMRLITLGIPAVTGITGVGGATKSARLYAPRLKGKRVWVAFDSSPAGRSAAQEVARTVSTYADTVAVFDPWPGRDDDSDMSDWFDYHGNDVERFKRELRKLEIVDRIQSVPSLVDVSPGGKFNHVVLGQYAEAAGGLRVGPGDHLWRYRDGCYRPDGKEWLQGFIRETLKEEWNANRESQVLRWCHAGASLRGFSTKIDDRFINVRNGLLDWRTGRLQAHSPEVHTVIQIAAAYEPRAKCPHIDEFVAEVLDATCVEFWWEWVGYCLVPTAKYQRALMVHGPADTGKSTLLKLLGTFLGPVAVSNHSLQALCDDRFAKADLFGKLVNIHADLDARSIQSSGTMKVLISGDPVAAERKYEQPFSFRSVARHVYSANEMPGTSDQSDAYYKRWFVLPMTNKVPITRQNPLLESTMTTAGELSGMLNRALKGLERLEQRGRFKVPRVMEEALQAYRQDTDTIIGWSAERLEIGPARRGIGVTIAEAYNDYGMWCKENNRRPFGRQKFRQHWEERHPNVETGVTHGQVTWRGVRVRQHV